MDAIENGYHPTLMKDPVTGNIIPKTDGKAAESSAAKEEPPVKPEPKVQPKPAVKAEPKPERKAEPAVKSEEKTAKPEPEMTPPKTEPTAEKSSEIFNINDELKIMAEDSKMKTEEFEFTFIDTGKEDDNG